MKIIKAIKCQLGYHDLVPVSRYYTTDLSDRLFYELHVFTVFQCKHCGKVIQRQIDCASELTRNLEQTKARLEQNGVKKQEDNNDTH